MRVDFVITELFVGGAERCLTELAVGLAEKGDRVRVFSLASLPSGDQRLLVDRLQQAQIPLASGEARYPASRRHAYHRPAELFRATSKLTDWLRDGPPDICQTFLFHANALGTLAAGRAGVALKVGGVRVAEVKPLRCFLERQAVKRMDSLVCVSQGVRRFATTQLGCDPAKSIVIPNAVEVSRFANAKPVDWSEIGWPADSIVTLFVGRLHPQKGIDLIQRQIDRLAPIGSNRRVLLVGDGPLRDDLSRWADSLDHNRVKLLPWQSDIAPLMKSAMLLLLPSRYEGMPNVVLEAMASGRPVVCSKVEGIEELLAHGQPQQSFACGDSDAMADRVESILDHDTISDELGRKNLEHVRARFSTATMIAAYRQHYQALMDGQ
jgi:glycosyltransferase involved in cell wall biosynthesis